MGQLNLKAVFTLIEKVSGPMSKVMKSTEGVRNAFGKLSNGARSLSKRLVVVKKETDEIDKSQTKAQKSADKLGKVWGALAGSAAGMAFGKFVGDILNVNGAFEDYTSLLENTYNSSERANAAMAWIANFAARTPFELAKVTDAFVKLTNYGIDPQARAMQVLGDTASGMKKSYDQAVEALADAKTGEFERLKEFGIRTNKTNKGVIFSYNKMGKEISVISKATGAEIERNILDILDSKFKGKMDKASKNFNGLKSNIKDLWAAYQLKTGKAGFFDHVKKRMDELYSSLSSKKGEAQMSAKAQKMSDALIRLFDAIDKLVTKVDWDKVVDGATWLVSNFENLVNLGVAAWIFATIMGLNGLAVTLGVVSVAGAPIGAIILAIAALAAIAYLVWRNWEPIKKWWADLWADMGKKLDGFVALNKAFWEMLKSNFADGVSKLWNILPTWFQGLIKGTLKLIAPTVGFSAAPVALANTSGNQAFNHNLRVQLEGAPVKSVNMTKPEKGSSLTVGYNGKQ